MKNNSDKIFEVLAKSYTDTEGRMLLAELSEDKIINFERAKFSYKQKSLKRNLLIGVAAIAAAVAVAFTVPNILDRLGNLTEMENVGITSGFVSENEDKSGETDLPGMYNVGGFKFYLPQKFKIEYSSLDNGQATVFMSHYGGEKYYLQMENFADMNLSGFEEIEIGGNAAYYMKTTTFDKLVVKKNDVLYVFTGDENNTLLRELAEGTLNF